MRGVVFTGERQIEFMEFPDPTPGPGEVVVKIKASGMCGSDLHQYRRRKPGRATIGRLPINSDPVIAGHEPCGSTEGVEQRLCSSQVGHVAPRQLGAKL